MKDIGKYASGIISISQDAKKGLTKFYNEQNIISPLNIDAHLGSRFNFLPGPTDKVIDSPYFVTIGSLNNYRKNIIFLLNIWGELVKKYGEKAPKLVVIGGNKAELEKNTFYANYKLIPNVIFESNCDDKKLMNYLYYSKALLFPSFAEGFGMPIMEALGLKIPVILSDIEVFREIAKDVPEYHSPIDGMAWMKTIEDYSQEHSILREAQLKRIESFSLPTWKNHFEKVNKFIETIQN